MNEALPGSIALEAIQFLRSQGLREVSSGALADGIGRPIKGLHQKLAPAVHAGLLSRVTNAGFAFWSLGPKADPNVAPADLSPDGQERQRVIKVSANATNSIFAYADQRRAAPFSVALHTDGRMAIERHGRLVVELTNAERALLVHAATNGVSPC